MLLFILGIIFFVLFRIGSDPYEVRTSKYTHYDYRKRPTLYTYFHQWIERRKEEIDSSSSRYPVYFILSDGGASRSAFWVSSVLGKLEDETNKKFSKHLFCLSGASGGSLGNGTFYALLMLDRIKGNTLKNFSNASQGFLKRDFLSHSLARMLGGDAFGYITIPFPQRIGKFKMEKFDRADALEYSMERNWIKAFDNALFSTNFSDFVFSKYRYQLPVFFINATRMQDGYPAVISTINIDRSTNYFNHRVDILNLLPHEEDIHLSTAIVLGARFPFLNPAGNIKNQYFVDGGYFDNSGSGIVHEMIRALKAYSNDPKLSRRASKLKYIIIHITNSPSPSDQVFETISPISNDITSPMRTLFGAYNSQTSIMDRRLAQYATDIRAGGDTIPSYFLIPLYKSKKELKPTDKFYVNETKTELPYSMNWHISQPTILRMKDRLDNSQGLNQLIELINKDFK